MIDCAAINFRPAPFSVLHFLKSLHCGKNDGLRACFESAPSKNQNRCASRYNISIKPTFASKDTASLLAFSATVLVADVMGLYPEPMS